MVSTDFFFRNFVYYPVAAYQAGPVRRRLSTLLDTQFQDRALTLDLQRTRLADLARHAAAHTPFYASRLDAVLDAPDPVAALIDVPFLRKADLQEHADDLTSRATVGRMTTKTTGGSTGEPVTIWKTRPAWAWELAATWRGYAWAGIGVADLQARFWGVPQDRESRLRARAIDFACHRVRLPAFAFTEEDMASYVGLLDRKRPRHFYGYVSMLTAFARFLQGRGIRLGFRPRAVVTTSEVLTAADRELLREVFGAPVFNEYGCGELGTIAHECPEGALHLTDENMLIEICEGDRRCAPGEVGEIVVTELNNVGFPLIRYRLGDFGCLSGETCACGRTLGVLGGLHGRAYDFVRNARGQMFHGEFIMYLFEDLRRAGSGIKQFQFIQDDLDVFTVRIVRSAQYDPASEDVIRDRIVGKVEPEARVTIEYVDAIERERSGKLRVIKGLGRADEA